MKYRIERWGTTREKKRKVVFEIEGGREVRIITKGFRCAAETEKIVAAVEGVLASERGATHSTAS